MKHFYRGCAGVVLMLVLSIPVFAGQIPCGGITEPPPPPSATSSDQTTDETSSEMFDVVMTLLQGVLSVF